MLAGDRATEKNKAGEEGGVLGPSSYKPGGVCGSEKVRRGTKRKTRTPVLSNRALTRIVPGHW